MNKIRNHILKALIVTFAASAAAYSSTYYTLAYQSNKLRLHGEYHAEAFQKYKYFAFQIGTNAAIGAGLLTLIAMLLIPSNVDAMIHKWIIQQAIKARSRNPMSDQELEVVAEVLETTNADNT